MAIIIIHIYMYIYTYLYMCVCIYMKKIYIFTKANLRFQWFDTSKIRPCATMPRAHTSKHNSARAKEEHLSSLIKRKGHYCVAHRYPQLLKQIIAETWLQENIPRCEVRRGQISKPRSGDAFKMTAATFCNTGMSKQQWSRMICMTTPAGQVSEGSQEEVATTRSSATRHWWVFTHLKKDINQNERKPSSLSDGNFQTFQENS